MRIRKNVLLLFSKVPEAGLVKTRLTVLKDGVFQPDVASGLYHCMLFDVTEICCAAMTKLEARPHATDPVTGEEIVDTYEMRISTAPAENLEKMRELFAVSGTWPREIVFVADEGKSFDEHYNDAFQKAWDDGADTILSMGADMPALTVDDVVRGFEALQKLNETEKGGIVLSPDQEMSTLVLVKFDWRILVTAGQKKLSQSIPKALTHKECSLSDSILSSILKLVYKAT